MNIDTSAIITSLVLGVIGWIGASIKNVISAAISRNKRMSSDLNVAFQKIRLLEEKVNARYNTESSVRASNEARN